MPVSGLDIYLRLCHTDSIDRTLTIEYWAGRKGAIKPVLTKQHFEVIARLIRDNTYLNSKTFETYIKREDFINQLIRYFKDQNLNFDSSRFKQACDW